VGSSGAAQVRLERVSEVGLRAGTEARGVGYNYSNDGVPCIRNATTNKFALVGPMDPISHDILRK
jgi:hypothetical protein